MAARRAPHGADAAVIHGTMPVSNRSPAVPTAGDAPRRHTPLPGTRAMYHTVKGTLLSALVLPGLGQLVLGRRRRGWVLIGIVLATLSALVAQATGIALRALAQLEAAGGTLDTPAVTAAARDALAAGGAGTLRVLLLGLAACWLFAIVDAWRIGRALDRARAVDALDRARDRHHHDDRPPPANRRP